MLRTTKRRGEIGSVPLLPLGLKLLDPGFQLIDPLQQ
jgi:hypothetical protein